MMKALIIGDSCEDMFRYGTCDRLSPEAPVPVMKPTRTTGNGGMAINVFENLKALGVSCDIITNDIRPVKTRYVDEISNQVLLRVDENDDIKPITVDILENVWHDDYDAVVISDYNKGFLNEDDIKYIAEHHPLVFMDTKKKIGDWAHGVEFIKINEIEFFNNSEWLVKYYEGELVVTRGKNGAKHWFHDHPIELKEQYQVMDLSGAGDTFLAALVASYLKNDDICTAICFANRCAAWVVSQKGIVVVNLEKI